MDLGTAERDEHARRSARWPFEPARVPFFYGWVIVIVGTIGMLASMPGQTNGVSVFTDSLIENTGLSRLQLATAYLVGTGASGLLLPTAGGWIDRFGARLVSLGAVIGLAVTISALSLVGPMSATVGLIVMSAGFACLRFSGQGLLTLSSRTMVSRWFDRRRGIVTAVSGAAMSYAFSISPAALLWLVDTSGWRMAWRELGLGLVVVMGSMVVLFYRDNPEDCGLLVDGDGRTLGVTAGDGSDGEDMNRSQALRDIRFWLVTGPIVVLSLASTALTFHILDLGTELGMDRDEIIWIFVPISLVAIPVGLISGWMVDRIPVVSLAVAMSVAELVMFATVGEMSDPAFRWTAIVAWGVAQGMYGPLTTAALPRLFGRTHLGSIGGAQMSAMVIGSAIGPALFAFVEATTGRYRAALWLSMIVPLVVLLVAGVRAVRPSGTRW